MDHIPDEERGKEGRGGEERMRRGEERRVLGDNNIDLHWYNFWIEDVLSSMLPHIQQHLTECSSLWREEGTTILFCLR